MEQDNSPAPIFLLSRVHDINDINDKIPINPIGAPSTNKMQT